MRCISFKKRIFNYYSFLFQGEPHSQHNVFKIYFPPQQQNSPTGSRQTFPDLETSSMAKEKRKLQRCSNSVTQLIVSAFVPKTCHNVTTALNPGIFLLLLLVFLHPAEGLVLWEWSWHRMVALFFMTKHHCSCKVLICAFLTKTKENQGNVTLHDTIPRSDNRFEIYLTSLKKKILFLTCTMETAVKRSSTPIYN